MFELKAYSSIGKMRLKVYVGLFVVNTIVLVLSAKVNQFQEFFYMADLFPFGLSITTLVLLSVILMLDFSLSNPVTSRPPFQIGILSVLTILWLAFNAFSTARWRYIPLACSRIPDGFADERVWCRELQALKAFVWIEWAALLLSLLFTTRFVISEHRKGNTHVWATTLSRYAPYGNGKYVHHRSSSFWTGNRSFASGVGQY